MNINFRRLVVALVGCVSIATVSFASASTSHEQVQTDQAPKAIGPYSQAVKAGHYLFVSGQIGIDPASGKLIGESIQEQTKQVLRNIEAILAVEGLSFENIVKTEVYMKDLKDFQVMNTIYAEKFSCEVKAARATIEVSKLPLGALVEISCVAFIP